MTVYLRCSEAFSKKGTGTKIRYPTYRKRIGCTVGLIYGLPYVSRVLLILWSAGGPNNIMVWRWTHWSPYKEYRQYE